MSNNEKYLTFALPLIRGVLANEQNAINDIINYSAYRAAQNIKADRLAAYRQLLYMACRHPEQVPPTLTDEVEEYLGEDAADFLDDELRSAAEIDSGIVDEFAECCEADEDVLEWYKLYLAQEVVGVKLGSIQRTLETCRTIQNQYGEGQIPVSISTSSIFVFRDEMKTEYDRVKFAYYIGIRSLCGNGVAVTTSTAIKWRMVGARNADELKLALLDKKIKSVWEKYTSKRKYYEIMNELISSKLIREMPYNRRICVTASVMDEAAFVEAIAAKMRTMYAARKNAEASQSRNRLKSLLTKELNKN